MKFVTAQDVILASLSSGTLDLLKDFNDVALTHFLSNPTYSINIGRKEVRIVDKFMRNQGFCTSSSSGVLSISLS